MLQWSDLSSIHARAKLISPNSEDMLERFGFQKGKVYSTKCPPCHSSVHATGREKAERQSKQQKKHPRQRQYCSCLLSLMFSSKGSIMKSFTGPLLVVTHLVNSSAGG